MRRQWPWPSWRSLCERLLRPSCRLNAAPPCARWRSPFAHHIWPIYALGRVAFQAHLGNVEPCSGDRAGFFVSDVGCDVRSWSSRDRCWVEDVVSVCGPAIGRSHPILSEILAGRTATIRELTYHTFIERM